MRSTPALNFVFGMKYSKSCCFFFGSPSRTCRLTHYYLSPLTTPVERNNHLSHHRAIGWSFHCYCGLPRIDVRCKCVGEYMIQARFVYFFWLMRSKNQCIPSAIERTGGGGSNTKSCGVGVTFGFPCLLSVACLLRVRFCCSNRFSCFFFFWIFVDGWSIPSVLVVIDKH